MSAIVTVIVTATVTGAATRTTGGTTETGGTAIAETETETVIVIGTAGMTARGQVGRIASETTARRFGATVIESATETVITTAIATAAIGRRATSRRASVNHHPATRRRSCLTSPSWACPRSPRKTTCEPLALRPPLTPSLKADEYRFWLREERGKYLDELSSEQAHKYFRRFIRRWNDGALPRECYAPHDSTATRAKELTA